MLVRQDPGGATVGQNVICYMTYIMAKTLVSSISVGGSGDIPIETVTFNYTKLTWTYITQDKAMAPDGTIAKILGTSGNKHRYNVTTVIIGRRKDLPVVPATPPRRRGLSWSMIPTSEVPSFEEGWPKAGEVFPPARIRPTELKCRAKFLSVERSCSINLLTKNPNSPRRFGLCVRSPQKNSRNRSG